jgi:hypothetical protein
MERTDKEASLLETGESKVVAATLENLQMSDSLAGSEGNYFDANATKRLLRKLDIRLVPILATLYLQVYDRWLLTV